jgi:hypothetical protein
MAARAGSVPPKNLGLRPLTSAFEEVTMAVSRPQTQIPEALRWGIHHPNPPDPALALLLEYGDPSVRQAVLGGLVKLNIATLHAQVEFWTGVDRAMGQRRG